MILCARSTSRSSEQSAKRRSRSETMLKVCLFYSQNIKILWLSNMEDTRLEKFTRCAKVCGLFFLDCALRVLIGCAGRLWSRGSVISTTLSVTVCNPLSGNLWHALYAVYKCPQLTDMETGFCSSFLFVPLYQAKSVLSRAVRLILLKQSQ